MALVIDNEIPVNLPKYHAVGETIEQVLLPIYKQQKHPTVV